MSSDALGRISALIIVLITLIIGQNLVDSCETFETCDECLKSIDCAWCLQPRDSDTGMHCFQQDSINETCSSGVINPRPFQRIIKDEKLNTADLQNVVQMKPQEIALKLRKDEEYEIGFKYKQSDDFPVDLYYIMDLSASLKSDKEHLAKIGVQLVETMAGLTRDFKIGFGSFVDKTDAPFISTKPAKIESPCFGCVKAYSFKNHLSLTPDGTQFSTQVGKAQISGNLDVPEGGFDALMQAMVCHKEIGWRDSSTRIIVFVTDAAFHVAGDGKLAGVVIPNDGKCHMKDNEYTGDLTYDYPSISHINYVAKQNNIHILFVVKEKVEQIYKNLERIIFNSKAVALKSEVIIDEIRKFYENISTSVKFTFPQSTNALVNITSTCENSEENTNSQTIECTNISPGSTLDFKVKITPTKCIEGTEVINIRPGSQNSTLQINLRTTCECEDCGDETTEGVCNNHGTLHCAVCDCNEGFNGKFCECDKSKNEDFEKNDKCIAANETETCSGRGSCRCNVCKCELRSNGQIISGKYCECDNFSCPKTGSQICGGNGECVCGACKCKPGWSGGACECIDNMDSCLRNGVCSNHGKCQCGKCVCDKEYFGEYCEECTTCYGGKCDELKPCVECKVHNKGKYKDDCDLKCTEYTINIVDTINDDEEDESKVCRYIEENCKLVFSYKYEDNKIVASTLKELQCSEPINLIGLILGIIGAILVIGILTLVAWKFWTNYHDKKEYARFMEEREKSRWGAGDNPIFKSPVTHFKNPTYGQRSSMFNRRSRI